MAATSRSTRSTPGTTLRSALGRPLSPSGRLSGSPSAFASSTSSSFATRSTSFFHRSASPTRVSLVGSGSFASPASSSVRFAVSPSRDSQIVKKPHHHHHHQHDHHASARQPSHPRRTCMCSPTTHPGSFRCALHKNAAGFHHASSAAPSHRLNARRSAMTNSLVRIGTVEGDLVKRALAALIRPSSHQQRRRGSFQPRPSRLSVMSKAFDDLQ